VNGPVVDCDVHCAPASLEDLRPFMDGYWFEYATNAGITGRGLAGAYPPAAREAPIPSRYDQLGAGFRLDDGSLAILNCLALFGAHRHPYYTAALASAVNDWLRDEWLARDPRLRASIVVPHQFPDLAVEEIRRVGTDPGFVQVLLPVRTDVPYGNRRYRELFAAAAEHDLVVGLHAWGRGSWAATPTGLTSSYFEDYLNNQLIAQSHVLSLVSEGVFVEHPSLHVCLIECGFAWLPALLWRFDKDWKGLWREVPWVKEPPSAYVRRHFRATTAPAGLPPTEAEARTFVQAVEPAFLLYASDYPHVHGTLPTALVNVLGSSAQHVLRENALGFYRLGEEP
jgi:predicted TIM-barrel fold metal-dependent hydrolase